MKLFKTVLLAAALALSATAASALPITITGMDNFGTVVTATGASPINFGPTTLGSWTAQGQALGTPPAPLGTLLSNTIAFNTTGPGSLTVWITENGLTGPLSPVVYTSKLTSNGFTGPLTATLSTYLQSNNSTPGPLVTTGVLLDTMTFADIGTQTASVLAITGIGPYSLTQKYVINALGAGGANLTILSTAATAVPEPASLALFGAGLFGLAFFSLQRRKKSGSLLT